MSWCYTQIIKFTQCFWFYLIKVELNEESEIWIKTPGLSNPAKLRIQLSKIKFSMEKLKQTRKMSKAGSQKHMTFKQSSSFSFFLYGLAESKFFCCTYFKYIQNNNYAAETKMYNVRTYLRARKTRNRKEAFFWPIAVSDPCCELAIHRGERNYSK